MAARKTLQLDGDSRAQLQRIVKRASNWREREQAQTLLLLDAGVFAQKVAQHDGFECTYSTYYAHAWRQSAMASLPDLPRSGAPKKLQPEHVVRLVQWATAEPLTSAASLTRHLDAGGPKVHVNTMTAALKASSLVWKRTRHSLKKAAARTLSCKQPYRYKASKTKRPVERLIWLAWTRQVFRQCTPTAAPPLPPDRGQAQQAAECAWGAAGKWKDAQCCVLGDSDSGCVCGLSWLAALASEQTADGDFGQRLHLQGQEHPAVNCVFENARRDAAFFAPLQSPEPNRIERLWHKIKYTEMAIKCRTAQDLEADVGHIVDNFGKTYKFDFYGK